MKKLMVAIAAAATALGLYAAGVDDAGFVSGTSFDDGDGQTALGIKTLDALNAYDEGWSTNDPATTLEVKAYGADEALAKPYRPLEWREQFTQANYLNVKTALDKPLTRAYTPATSLATADFYVDTLVKFTACDEEITTLGDADAKIAVWVKEDEDAGTTDLMITAGYIENENGTVSTKNYNCGSFSGIDAWHRLTVKAIGDISKDKNGLVGFVVFIDGNETGTALACDDDKGYDGYKAILNDVATLWDNNGQLFPSIKGKVARSISALAVAGQGGIDDIAFTATAPDFANKAAATITWDPAKVAWVSIDGGETKVTTGSIVVEAGTPVTITAEPVENYMITSGTGDWTPAADDSKTVVAAKIGVTIGDQKFATFADAIAYINGTKGSASGALTVNFASDFVPEAFATTITPAAGVTSLTIDLAGKTLTYEGESGYAISCAVPLTITDLSEKKDGKITATSEDIDGIIQISAAVDFTVDAGILDGFVYDDYLDNVIITGGKFLSDDNSGFYLWDGETEMIYDDKTYQATYSEAEGYWTVAEKQIKTFKIMVVVNGETVQEEDVEEDAEFTPETPTLKGWQKLDGWKDGAGADVVFPVTVTAAATYTAQTSLNLTKDDDAYQIGTPAELQILQAYVADGQDTTGMTFKQTDTIDLAGIAWAGIGTYVEGEDGDACFAGTYDGNGKEIINLELAADEYTGLFQQLSGTLKNLTINCLGWVEDATGILGGAIAVGHACDGALISGVTTKGEFKGCSKNAAGIAARVDANVTIENCTNEADLSTSGSKVGGIVAITDNGKRNPRVFKDVVISGCKNTGAITATGASTTGVGGILAYAQIYDNGAPAKTLIKDCVNEGVVSETSTTSGEVGTILGHTTCPVTFEGVNVAAADQKIVGKGTTVTGADYGTVADNKVTFPATLAKDTQFLVLKAGVAPVFELAVADDYIAFDTALAAATFDGITSATGVIETNVSETVTTFTAKAAAVGPMKPLIDGKEVDPADIVNTAKAGNVIKLTPGCNVTIDPTTNELKVDGVTAGTFPAYYVLTAGEDAGIPTVSLAISEDLSKNGATIAADETTPAIQVTDGTFKINLPQAKEGLYYGLEYADNMQFTDSTTVWAQDGTVVSAPAEGNGKFYRVVIDDKAHDGL